MLSNGKYQIWISWVHWSDDDEDVWWRWWWWRWEYRRATLCTHTDTGMPSYREDGDAEDRQTHGVRAIAGWIVWMVRLTEGRVPMPDLCISARIHPISIVSIRSAFWLRFGSISWPKIDHNLEFRFPEKKKRSGENTRENLMTKTTTAHALSKCSPLNECERSVRRNNMRSRTWVCNCACVCDGRENKNQSENNTITIIIIKYEINFMFGASFLHSIGGTRTSCSDRMRTKRLQFYIFSIVSESKQTHTHIHTLGHERRIKATRNRTQCVSSYAIVANETNEKPKCWTDTHILSHETQWQRVSFALRHSARKISKHEHKREKMKKKNKNKVWIEWSESLDKNEIGPSMHQLRIVLVLVVRWNTA